MDLAEGILLTIITASTPLLLAALGELVAERSGVLNLGVEGMMMVGAVVGFAVAFATGNAVARHRSPRSSPAWRWRRSSRCMTWSSSPTRSRPAWR